jgi:hypothetical protein
MRRAGARPWPGTLRLMGMLPILYLNLADVSSHEHSAGFVF